MISILDAKLSPILESVNSLRNEVQAIRDDMESSSDGIKSEIEFLGNLAWSNEQILTTMQSSGLKARRETTASETREASASTTTKFPFGKTEDLIAFESEIDADETRQEWCQYFIERMKSKKTLYSRRKNLKELMFSE